MKSLKAASLLFFVFFGPGLSRPTAATELDISTEQAKTTILLLEGAAVLASKSGEVVELRDHWKSGISGDRLQTKAMDSLAECQDQLGELKALLEGVLAGNSVAVHTAHTDAVLAKAAYEPVAKIVRAGATDEAIKLFAPLETQINIRLKEIVDTLSPGTSSAPDCSSCGDPACCVVGSLCCQDQKACPNGCL